MLHRTDFGYATQSGGKTGLLIKKIKFSPLGPKGRQSSFQAQIVRLHGIDQDFVIHPDLNDPQNDDRSGRDVQSWAISDPVSGAVVLPGSKVRIYYLNGMPRYRNNSEVKKAMVDMFDSFVQRMGAEKFMKSLERGRKKFSKSVVQSSLGLD